RSGNLRQRELHFGIFRITGPHAAHVSLLQFPTFMVAVRESMASDWPRCWERECWHLYRNLCRISGNFIESMHRRNALGGMGLACDFDPSAGLLPERDG